MRQRPAWVNNAMSGSALVTMRWQIEPETATEPRTCATRIRACEILSTKETSRERCSLIFVRFRSTPTGQHQGQDPRHVWSIRVRLQLERRVRDLALFNLAIDSKLRGCDLVALRVNDVAPNGYSIDRSNVRQRKTGRSVRFELTEVTRQALDDYLRISERKLGQCLFPGRGGPDQHLTTRQYARLVSERVSYIGLDPLKYARTRCAEPRQR
jgi:hypothetical protein